ncbi:MAG: ribonuclease HII [bacterium]
MHRSLVAGIDEAGRGPLAGPVTAAAVILDPARPIEGLDDSKKLSASRRKQLEREVIECSLYWSVAEATVEEIDELNILQASMLAMRRAVAGLGVMPELALVDGNRSPGLACATRPVVGGDSLHAEISAASILAKEARDRLMCELAVRYPVYGFDQHKGYPTRFHIQALSQHGPSIHHRRSFAPVKRVLGQ